MTCKEYLKLILYHFRIKSAAIITDFDDEINDNDANEADDTTEINDIDANGATTEATEITTMIPTTMTPTEDQSPSTIKFEDVRQFDDPLPIETIKLDRSHEDIQFILVIITDWWGEKAGAGIDYFDIVRLAPAISDKSKAECSAKSDKCSPIPQFCPTKDCISSEIYWSDKRYPGYYQKGCSTLGKDTPFEEKAKCVKKEAIKDLEPPYVIDTSDDSLLDDCTAWSDSAPCETEALTISPAPANQEEEKNVITDTFRIAQEDCSEGQFKIELINKDDGEPSGDFLSYFEKSNSSVVAGEDDQCFLLAHGLCGPDSISFKTPKDFFLTFCNGVIMLKLEYDHCG